MASASQSSDIISTNQTVELPSDVLDWFSKIPVVEKPDIIASAMRDYFTKTTENQQLLDWLCDMDYKIAFDDYGVEMVCIHPASIILTDDPDKLPHHIISLLDKQVSYTNFDICVDDNEQFWSCPKPNVSLENGLDTTNRTYITGAEIESYTIGDCLKMGRYEMTDMSLWFAVPKHFFPCLC